MPLHRPVHILTLSALALLAPTALADVEPHAGMLRYPAVSDSRIAFIYANQVWTVSRSGGAASPVAAPPGQAMTPRFSADGRMLAFTANYDGNRDIYTLPLAGGIPSRVTHHPTDESLCGWTDDGRLLFFARSMTGSGPARISRLYSVPAAGGLPTKLPMPYAGYGAISHDGQTVAFTPHSTDNATWRRYRGGMATDIWTLNLKSGESHKVTDWEGTDTIPMWGYNRAAKTIYYLSDNGPEHRLNIWSFDTENAKREQVTSFADEEVRWPSIGPGSIETKGKGEIVFQLGAKLMLLDLDSKQARAVSVTIPGARPTIKPTVEDAADFITQADLSPSGKRIVFGARGDLWSLPAKEGVTRNLTHSDGVFERDPSWSPDGKYIAYFSDESGEYELYLRPSDAHPAAPEKKEADKKDDKKSDEEPVAPAAPSLKGPVKLTNLGPGFRYNPAWSPDSTRIAFTDKAGAITLATLTVDAAGRTATAELKPIDTDPWAEQATLTWAGDSNWLAYTRTDDGTGIPAIWLYNVSTGEKTRLTTPMFACSSPCFDRKGEFLYYVSSREISNPKYADIDSTFVYAGTQRLMMVPLRADVKNPLAPRSDEEELKKDDKEKKDDKKAGDGAADKKDSDKKEGEDKKPSDDKPGEKKDAEKKDPEKKDEKKPEPKKPVKIELDDFEARALIIPVPAGRLGNLSVNDEGKLIYIRTGSRGEGEKTNIMILDPKDDQHEEKTVTADVGNYTLSANGKKILIRRGNKHQVLDAAAGGGKATDVPTSAMRVTINPRDEWKQIIADAWRLQRDFFYVQNMHGVDWPKMRERANTMLADAASREDVNYIIGELISQLNIGHAYNGAPGDISQAPNIPAGLLGCDFEQVAASDGKPAAYRFATIYTGAPWDADARGPLALPGPDNKRIKVGDYLLAVNGAPVDPAQDPWAAFIGLADRPVTLTVSDQPALSAANPNQREVLVSTTSSDQSVRFRAWIERNRAYVAARTDNKVGYIYVPDTGVNGQNELFRQFFGQRDKAALIIDERWNGGGQLPHRFIELLNRPLTNYWAKRDGHDMPSPEDGHQGPKCMLINGQAGSGGDMFPWLFKHNHLGRVIGTRTWGGLVGISGNPAFIDNGSMTVPTFGFYKLDGTWGVEGHGVDPDQEVIDDPALMTDALIAASPNKIADPQLDAAITYCLTEVQAHPFKPPTRPAAPDRTGIGIPEKDR